MRVLVLILAFIPALALAATAHLAWWLNIELHPQQSSYRGVPAAALSVPLARISPLSCQARSRQFNTAQCAEVRANHLQFRIVGDFNGDGKDEIAETAVAERPDGTRLSVLIISEISNPRKNQVFLVQGNGFSVVYREDGGIAWSPCMECGNASTVRWDRKRSTYVEQMPEDFGAAPSNNAFKPKLHRSADNMADKARHVVSYAMQFGLT